MNINTNEQLPELRFQDLTPEIIISCVEEHCGINLDSVITPYNSYVNRVYGLQGEDNQNYIVKFYRPGRWSSVCILEEHRFLFQCREKEIPVIPPLVPPGKESLGQTQGVLFSVFPLRAGRIFDITEDRDWVRLGAIAGRLHQVGRVETAKHRLACSPTETTQKYCREMVSGAMIVPNLIDEFEDVCSQTLELISPLFDGIENIRIHGDCHRGNILDRAEEGLLLIDFDDMMMGPPVQDLWLLLPGHLSDCRLEMDLLLRGYNHFSDFDHKTLILIEPLRFMRIIYFLTWCALQKNDHRFRQNFPDWGTESFWIKEIEDLKYQLQRIREHVIAG